MKKVAVVFWSGSGNTEAMADYIVAGASAAGSEVALFPAAAFNMDMMDDYEAVAFGCPAMGAEVLEDLEFEPMFDACRSKLGGKRIALFGSYGWGDGEWMRNWEVTCRGDGAVLVCEPAICNEAPEAEDIEACRALGAALAR